jgi:hypothetical protein
MYKQFFANMESVALPMFAFGLFFSAFVLMLLRTFAWKRKADFDPMAAMPLVNDEIKEVKP